MTLRFAARHPVSTIAPRASGALRARSIEAALQGLYLDFANREYWLRGRRYTTPAAIPGWSFTRSGTRYAGDTTPVLFGANVPRIVPGSGIRVTAGATNLALWSQDFSNAAWSKGNVAIAANAIAAPDGTTPADAYINTSGTLSRNTNQTATVATATVYTASIFIRCNSAGALPWVEITTVSPTALRTFFNVQTGAVGTVAHTSASVTNVGNGWFRCSVTWTTAATSAQFYVSSRPANNDSGSATGDGTTPQFFIWGAQLETGSVATDYIPTTTTSATAGADAASVTGLTFSGAHSVIALTGATNNTTATLYQLDDGSNANRSRIYRSTTNWNVFADSGSANQADVSAGAYATTAQRLIARIGANDVQAALNGALGTQDLTVTLPVGTLSRLQIGSDGSNPINGWLQLMAVLPRLVSGSEATGGSA